MNVFKFGGASVKDADAVRNVLYILQLYKGKKLGVVISAMRKTTNATEEVVNALWNRNESLFTELVEERRAFHLNIMNELFSSNENGIFAQINKEFDQLLAKFDDPIPDNFDFEYDQIVSLGEVISTRIVAAYIQQEGVKAQWLDARKLVRTDHQYRQAEINWEKTTSNFHERFMPEYANSDVLITQGFIGHTSEGFTTTLGREGSDFSAGIMAYCCDAEDVTIWKDVPGMLNADPKWFDNTVKLEQISFKEAIELSYYGASVIHPKTLQPLQGKEIPLYVKSFLNPEAPGTRIGKNITLDPMIPCFIVKKNQVLISLSSLDFSYIVEENISEILTLLHACKMKVDVIENSGISF